MDQPTNNNSIQDLWRHQLDDYVPDSRFIANFETDSWSWKDAKYTFVCDDSGSMNEKTKEGRTRWQELLRVVEMIISISCLMDPTGVDIYFLNRTGMSNVTSFEQVRHLFQNQPSGSTPIVPVLEDIYESDPTGKRLVILITDGAPTKKSGASNITEFKSVLKNRGLNDHVAIVACTDDESTMEYLNGWDEELKNLDVIDDYESEKRQILKVQGKNFGFSFGDYVVKIMWDLFVLSLIV